jgi:hypothetical protein
MSSISVSSITLTGTSGSFTNAAGTTTYLSYNSSGNVTFPQNITIGSTPITPQSLVPSQSSQNGKFLTTDGSTSSWANISNKVVSTGTGTYAVRTVWPDQSSNEYWTGTYTKVSPTSFLYVQLNLSMRGNYSDALVHESNYANGSFFQGVQPYDAGFTANSRPFYTTFLITSSATGANTIRFRWRTANGTGGNKPAQIWNPNSSDDGRYTQEYSRWFVWEIES